MLINGDGAYGVGDDATGDGVLDLGDMSSYGGIDGATVLEGTVAGGIDGAVLKRESVNVAEWLFACNVTTDESQVLTMPTKVLAIEVRVIDRDVLGLPEGVFSDDMGVTDYGILDVLEDIFRIALESIDIHVLAEHEGVGSFVQTYVAHHQVLDLPEGLVGIVELYALQFQAIHLPEKFGSVYDAIAHHHIVAIPDGRAGTYLKIAVGNERCIHVPPRVFANKATMVCLQALTAFDTALAFGNRNVFESGVVNGKQGTFTSESLVFDELHSVLCFYL